MLAVSLVVAIACAGSGGEGEDASEGATETGDDWTPTAYPVEFLSLSGARGAALRATVSSFGPLLLSKVLDLNATHDVGRDESKQAVRAADAGGRPR